MFDASIPAKIQQWIENNCPLSSGDKAGECVPMLPWLADLTRNLFGKRREDGTRQIREASVWVPKKNGKSWYCSALAIYHARHIKGGQVVLIASSAKQAEIVFNECVRMLELGPQRPYWGKGLGWHSIPTKRQIEYRHEDGFLSVIHVLPCKKGISGYHADLIIMDEIVDWKASWAEEIYDTLKNAGATRNGLLISISTPKFDLSHFARFQWLKAKELIDGEKTNPTFFPLIYGIPDESTCICGPNCGEGWRCPEWWWRANPGAGLCIPKQDFIDDYASVKENPREESRWRTLRCGQWVSSSDQWVSSAAWAACRNEFEERDLWGHDAIACIDAARKYDLAAMCLLIKKDGVVWVLPRAWIPRDLARHKEQTDKIPYSRWHDKGLVRFCEGDVIKPADIREQLIEDASHFRIKEVRYDDYGMSETADLLAKEFDCVAVTQNANGMAPATARLEQLIINRQVRIPDNPLLDWCLGNCRVKIDQHDRIMLDKKNSYSRIDLIVCIVIGLTAFMAEEEDEWSGSMCGIM